MASRKQTRTVEIITHDKAARKNIPTAEYQSLIEQSDQSLIQVAYQCRNRDLDPQLVWRGKDEQDWSDLVPVRESPVLIDVGRRRVVGHVQRRRRVQIRVETARK